MNKTIIVSCTWGQGSDVMVVFKTHPFILYENPRHNKPPQGDYKHGFVIKGSCDLTEKEARALGNALIQAADKAQKYEKAIEDLDDKHRQPFVLSEISGLSYEQIAVALEIPVGTVRSRKFNAFRKLKEKLMILIGAQR